MDTAFKFFKVFPNPVHSGTDLTIEWNKAEAGYYTLQLFDQDGKMIHQREVWIDAEAKLLNLQLPSIASGVYFIRATAKQSRKSYTEKIIVQ
jgi:hypothetical protein